MFDQFDQGLLRAAFAAIPEESWPLPSDYATNGVHHRYRKIELIAAGRRMAHAELFRFVLDEFAPVVAARVSWIDSGGFIVPHRDRGPWFERWHVPIQAAGLFDEYRPEAGTPFPVEHWAPHAVWNDGDQPRVHLVIDRHVPINRPSQPFATFPIPEQWAHLVELAHPDGRS